MDWKAKYLTKADVESTEKEQREKTKWGRWTLSKDAPASLDIHPYAEKQGVYEVVLFEKGCGFVAFIAWLGRWVQHLHLKGWMAHSDLGHFVEAAQDVYSSGRGK